MIKNKSMSVFEIIILVVSVIAVSYVIDTTNLVSAQESPLSCCSVRNDGALCTILESDECGSDCVGNCVPGSCEATSFCALGCCVDEERGSCEVGTPQQACVDRGGVWDDNVQCNIPQCNKGCCILGTNTKFVTVGECGELAQQRGFELDFNPGVTTEIECLARAYSVGRGACVIGIGEDKICKVVSGKECNTLLGHTFREGLLCTAPSLGDEPICERTEETTFVAGKDEVYFKDSCGNAANIYDASKINNNDYWTFVVSKEDSCSDGLGSANSPTCGNCDRFLSSKYGLGDADYGNLVCKGLSCVDGNGRDRENGETWCVYDGRW